MTLKHVQLISGGFLNVHIPSWLNWTRYLSLVGYALNALTKIEYMFAAPFLYVITKLTCALHSLIIGLISRIPGLHYGFFSVSVFF